MQVQVARTCMHVLDRLLPVWAEPVVPTRIIRRVRRARHDVWQLHYQLGRGLTHAPHHARIALSFRGALRFAWVVSSAAASVHSDLCVEILRILRLLLYLPAAAAGLFQCTSTVQYMYCVPDPS